MSRDKSQAALLANIPVASFIQNVASRSPAPGGGSVAALAGSLAAGLGAMVCRLTVGKKAYKDVEDEMRRLEKEFLTLRDKLRDNVDEDTFAFDDVMAALQMPDGPEKDAALEEASRRAAEVPLNTMELAVQTARLLVPVAEKGNVNSISDVGVGFHSLRTAFYGGMLNVRINTKDMPNSEWKKSVMERVMELRQEFESLFEKGTGAVHRKLWD